MKEKIIIANWKMQLGIKETEILTEDILARLSKLKEKIEGLDIVFCPSPAALGTISRIFYPKPILSARKTYLSHLFLGAQNCFWESKGAFTGEVSPSQLKELGCRYVIIGHSERRQNLGETDEMIGRKARAVLETGLIPIICLGETFEQRQRGVEERIIINQTSKILKGTNLKSEQEIIVAYEPIWAIGSGRAVDVKEAEHMSQIILQRMVDFYPPSIVKNNIRIIYGGSVDSSSVEQFVRQETIDGVLVGGASLKAEEFVKMIKELISWG